MSMLFNEDENPPVHREVPHLQDSYNNKPWFVAESTPHISFNTRLKKIIKIVGSSILPIIGVGVVIIILIGTILFTVGLYE